MDSVVTIAERTKRATERRRQGIAAVMAELREYAAETGGSFLIFGSAAKDLVRPHSDLDVIIDFPAGLETAAWDRVEEVCRAHGIPCDVHSASRSSPAFVERMRKHAVMLA